MYFAAWKVKYPDRTAFQTKLGTDKALLDLFKADVIAYRESKIDGTTWDSKSVKTRLESIIAKDVRFIKPLDQFYPSRLYKQCCKDGKWPKKQKEEHKFEHQDGASGYLVPSPDAAKMPWSVETVARFTTQ